MAAVASVAQRVGAEDSLEDAIRLVIRTDVVDGVIPRWAVIDPARVRVEVRGGVVRLDGTVERRSDAEILPHLVRGLDGVVDVESALEFVVDDRNVSPSREHRIS
jgi:osmotically-inducible protein OsmY